MQILVKQTFQNFRIYDSFKTIQFHQNFQLYGTYIRSKYKSSHGSFLDPVIPLALHMPLVDPLLLTSSLLLPNDSLQAVAQLWNRVGQSPRYKLINELSLPLPNSPSAVLLQLSSLPSRFIYATPHSSFGKVLPYNKVNYNQSKSILLYVCCNYTYTLNT